MGAGWTTLLFEGSPFVESDTTIGAGEIIYVLGEHSKPSGQGPLIWNALPLFLLHRVNNCNNDLVKWGH